MKPSCETCGTAGLHLHLAWVVDDIDTLKWICHPCIQEGYYAPFPALLCGPRNATVDVETMNAWREVIKAAYRMMGEGDKDERKP